MQMAHLHCWTASKENVAFYVAFNNPNDEEWDKEERKHLKLLDLLGVSTCYPLMLSALRIFAA